MGRRVKYDWWAGVLMALQLIKAGLMIAAIFYGLYLTIRLQGPN